MSVVNTRRIAELSLDLSNILSAHPGGLSRNEALGDLRETFRILPSELKAHPYRPFVPLFEEMIRVGNMALVRAGWLTERSEGYWEITSEGKHALESLPEADEFLKAAASHSLRARVAIAFPALYVALRRLKYQLSTDYHLVKRVGLKKVLTQPSEIGPSWEKVLPIQAVKTVVIDEAAAKYLEGRSEIFKAGLPVFFARKEAMTSPLRGLLRDYPTEASLVISQIGGADVAQSDRSSPLLIANLLSSQECGPKLYDLLQLADGDRLYQASVVEGLDFRNATPQESLEGRLRLTELEESGMIEFGSTYQESTPAPSADDPSFLVDERGRISYINFNRLALKDYESYLKSVAIDAIECSHFGDRSLLRGGHYLYQSIPGVRLPARRNTGERTATISRLMESIGARFEDQLVLDIGCNIGMMMAEYLRLGVKWCHGWDRPDVAPHAEQLLRALGCTRFSMTGCDIAHSAKLENDLPNFIKPQLDGCIISYLAVRKNLGFLDCLGWIPWSLLIYEGHEEETEAHFHKYLDDLRRLVRFEVKALETYHDGDCGERIIAMIVRTE